MTLGKAEAGSGGGGTAKQAKRRLGIMAVLSSLSYSFCSVSMVMSNKVRVYLCVNPPIAPQTTTQKTRNRLLENAQGLVVDPGGMRK